MLSTASFYFAYVSMAYLGDHLLNIGDDFQLPLLVFLGIEHPTEWFTVDETDEDTWIVLDSLGDYLQPEVDKLELEFQMYKITIRAWAGQHIAERIFDVLKELADESVSIFVDSALAAGIEELSISPDDYNFFFHLLTRATWTWVS